MIELAEREVEEHEALGRRAAAVCDEVILVGPERTRPIAKGLAEGGFTRDRLHVVRDRAEATARLGQLLKAGDVVLWENDLPDTYAEPNGETARTSQGAASDTPTPSPVGASLAQRPFRRRSPEDLPSVVVDGLRVVYRESGRKDAPPIVVLHGWGASIAAVASIHGLLASTPTDDLALDLPGLRCERPPPVVWGTDEYARAGARLHGRDSASSGQASSATRAAVKLAIVSPRRPGAGRPPGAGQQRRHSATARRHATEPASWHSRPAAALLACPPLAGPLGAPLRRRFEPALRLRRLPPGRRDARDAGRVVNEDVRHLLPESRRRRC